MNHMKLIDIIEHDIVPADKTKSRILWKLPKMKRVDPPFTKGAFKALMDITGGKQIENPAGGKVLKKTNTMKKGELCKKKAKKDKNSTQQRISYKYNQ